MLPTLGFPAFSRSMGYQIHGKKPFGSRHGFGTQYQQELYFEFIVFYLLFLVFADVFQLLYLSKSFVFSVFQYLFDSVLNFDLSL